VSKQGQNTLIKPIHHRPTLKRRLLTIFNHFRNKHARALFEEPFWIVIFRFWNQGISSWKNNLRILGNSFLEINRFYKIKIDNVTVEPIHVDHSIPAAYGFIIYTSEGPVVYTGDLRRHGPRKDLTEDFLERARAVEPIALICEETRMAQRENRQTSRYAKNDI